MDIVLLFGKDKDERDIWLRGSRGDIKPRKMWMWESWPFPLWETLTNKASVCRNQIIPHLGRIWNHQEMCLSWDNSLVWLTSWKIFLSLDRDDKSSLRAVEEEHYLAAWDCTAGILWGHKEGTLKINCSIMLWTYIIHQDIS